MATSSTHRATTLIVSESDIARISSVSHQIGSRFTHPFRIKINLVYQLLRDLCNPDRRIIIRLLAALGPLPVFEITTYTCWLSDRNIDQPKISEHLSLLLQRGILSMESRGKFNYYDIRPARLYQIKHAIADLLGSDSDIHSPDEEVVL